MLETLPVLFPAILAIDQFEKSSSILILSAVGDSSLGGSAPSESTYGSSNTDVGSTFGDSTSGSGNTDAGGAENTCRIFSPSSQFEYS